MHPHPDSDAASIPDREARERQLAATYDGPVDGWQRVQDYRRVQAHQQEHPTDGYHATATALNLNPNTVRNWVARNGKPDPMHAIETAERNGWLDTQPGERVFEALSLLIAWTYAGGSIAADTYSLTLAVSDTDPGPLARECLIAVGMKVETAHAKADSRATEYRPSGPGRSHLGRFLVGVLGAPRGSKAEQQLALPSWLASVPPETRTRWVQMYLTLRGTSGPDEGWIRVREQRNQSYIDELGALVQSVVDDASDVRIGDKTVLIRPRIGHLLQGLPRLPQS